MANEPVLSPKQAEAQRARVIDALTEHFAQDNLTMEELEQRLDQVYAANTASALTAVLEGLPSLSPETPTSVASAAQTSPLVRPQEGYGWRTLIALMSGITRRGAWIAPRRLQALAVMGGIELDFRSAQITHQVTEINILAIMGGVVVTVPRGMRVESDGFAIMGEFDDGHGDLPTTDPNAPVIRVRGVAIMGGVEVRVLDPGASGKQAGVIIV